ncbi:conserved Plasmodium protein, unknown function [Plasmodium ovale curtisi]|uniref:Uncharacterized protein n=1 Tax=Plasmodium ovale curtisi TaxID=864141 RepID=A0A1A8WJT3_PLAOA|nr:conserved Plasmodium protein, unknown function [Plasmodium ovale curtisi]
MDGAYGMRTVMNSSRLIEEPKYDMSTVDMGHSTMNTNYLMNGAVLTNAYSNNDFITNREHYPADMISQYKLDQTLNSYNNTVPMNTIMHADPNDSIGMHGMKKNLDVTGFDSYRNLINYNNTQNTIQTNTIPMNIEDYNTSDIMYMNPNTVDKFSADYLNNLPSADAETMLYSNNFKIPNGNLNTMMHATNTKNNYNSMPYSMPVFENMNNPQMYMQHMNQKQAMSMNTPTSKIEHTCSIRKMPAVSAGVHSDYSGNVGSYPLP